MQLVDFDAWRPPCSVAERELAKAVARQMRRAGLRPTTESVRAPTSPTWAPLLRALLRVWTAAFLAAGWPRVAVGLAAAAVLLSAPATSGLLRFLPLLGGSAVNVVARRAANKAKARPLVVVAHLDTHPTAGAPLGRTHMFAATTSGVLALVAALVARPGVGSRPVAALIAVEALFTLVWLARNELSTLADAPDDNTSGLLALVRLAELMTDTAPARDVWLVGTAGGTSGSYGLRSFLRTHRELKGVWVVEIDALGTGEVVASPHPPRFPYPGTPPALARAIVSAAHASGDPITVRRVRRPHSDARAALRRRTPAITLTGGLRPARGGEGPDPANAERAARIVAALAGTPDEP